jgi:RNA polymerase sigma-70 factor (ECF subfamily)
MTDFHELYTRYARDVHRFALYLSCDPALADDITSETFLRAWSSASPIREATVKAYLFTIARNLYLQERTRAARHVELTDSLPSDAASQGTRVEHQSTLTVVLSALRILPEVDRAALLMRSQDGMSYEEIAEALQLTLSSAKVKVHRARIKLAAMVERTAVP